MAEAEVGIEAEVRATLVEIAREAAALLVKAAGVAEAGRVSAAASAQSAAGALGQQRAAEEQANECDVRAKAAEAKAADAEARLSSLAVSFNEERERSATKDILIRELRAKLRATAAGLAVKAEASL